MGHRGQLQAIFLDAGAVFKDLKSNKTLCASCIECNNNAGSKISDRDTDKHTSDYCALCMRDEG